jgi:hypothetical protein
VLLLSWIGNGGLFALSLTLLPIVATARSGISFIAAERLDLVIAAFGAQVLALGCDRNFAACLRIVDGELVLLLGCSLVPHPSISALRSISNLVASNNIPNRRPLPSILLLERRGHAVRHHILVGGSEVPATKMLLRRLAALILIVERLSRVRGAQRLILDLILNIADGGEVRAILMVRGRLQLFDHSSLLLLEVVLLGLLVLWKAGGQRAHRVRSCLPRNLVELLMGKRVTSMAHLRRGILCIVLHFQNQNF